MNTLNLLSVFVTLKNLLEEATYGLNVFSLSEPSSLLELSSSLSEPSHDTPVWTLEIIALGLCSISIANFFALLIAIKHSSLSGSGSWLCPSASLVSPLN